MHGDFIYRLSLVTSSGLNLAEVPEADDTVKSQLSGGITSAILTFSREVHERDIEYLSYHDRTIAFVQYAEFIIVIEISSTIDRGILDMLISLFRDRTEKEINLLNPDKLKPSDAQRALVSIHESPWLHNFLDDIGFQRPLSGSNYSELIINHNNNGEYSLEKGEDRSYLEKISYMIHERNVQNKTRDRHTCGFIMINEINQAVFIISRNGLETSRVGFIEVSTKLIPALFRMAPLLIKTALKRFEENQDYTLDKLFSELKETHDIDPTESIKNKKFNQPLTLLEKKVKKVDQLLFTISTGDQVIIVGDEVEVSEIIDLLLIFNQHLITDVFTYYREGEKLNNDIIGMSYENCVKLKKEGIISPEVTVVDLDNKTIIGQNVQSNKFLKNLYDRTKTLPFSQGIDMIYRELELVITYAISATAYSTYSKGEALKLLQGLKSSINDNDQYEIIQLLAAKQNRWLSSILYDPAFDEDWI